MITIDTNVTFVFHGIFSLLAWSRNLSIFLFFVMFTLYSAETVKFTWWQVLFFLLINTISGLPDRVERFIFFSKSQRILCMSFSRMDYSLCIYNFIVWSNFNLLHSSQSITQPTRSCMVLFSFGASLLHSLIILSTISFSHRFTVCYFVEYNQFSL